MGNWTITIHGISCHHNEALEADANRLAAKFADELRAAGHNVEHASFTHGGREDLLSASSHTRTRHFPERAAAVLGAVLALALAGAALVACSSAQLQTAQTIAQQAV